MQVSNPANQRGLGIIKENNMKKKPKKIKKSHSISDTLSLENPHQLRWIICQHCKKPVYGVVVEKTVTPSKNVLAEWKHI